MLAETWECSKGRSMTFLRRVTDRDERGMTVSQHPLYEMVAGQTVPRGRIEVVK